MYFSGALNKLEVFYMYFKKSKSILIFWHAQKEIWIKTDITCTVCKVVQGSVGKIILTSAYMY